MLKSIWNWFKQPAARWAGMAAGVLGTALFLVVFFQGVAFTNTMEFCTSCHSMTFPYEEYKKSAHFKNSVGVQATCVDCHVPHDYPDLLIAKVMAAKDVYHEILGTVNTKEKFEEHRLQMAKAVWAKMEKRGSKECHACHQLTDMVIEDHGRRARRKHKEAIKDGKHCIQCHKGVVHELPKGYEG